MSSRALLLLPLILLSGCEYVSQEYSKVLTEPGEVYDTAFVPEGHGHDTAIGINTGKSGGVTVTPVHVDIPARYAVVFKCQHGKFVIEGENAKRLYEQLDRGDKVEIFYREVFQVTRERKVEKSRRVVDLDFVDAKKVSLSDYPVER